MIINKIALDYIHFSLLICYFCYASLLNTLLLCI
nr:MAG TPA: hypothetical protein [Caudoviricetes sp.]